jgi:hypothetical protein
VPGVVNVYLKVAPTGRFPLSNFPLSVTVWAIPPLFVQITVVPTVIVMLAGLKPESVTVTWTVDGCGFGVGVGVAARVGAGVGVAACAGITLAVGVAVGLAMCVGVGVDASVDVTVGPDAVDWPEAVGVAAGVDADLFPNKVVTP